MREIWEIDQGLQKERIQQVNEESQSMTLALALTQPREEPAQGQTALVRSMLAPARPELERGCRGAVISRCTFNRREIYSGL